VGAEVDSAEVTRLACTIDTWQEEVFAFLDTHASNGPTESVIIGSEREDQERPPGSS
jgi:transposase